MQRIRTFTHKIVEETSQVDPRSGRRVIQLGDQRFEILHQKEKDRFYLETGYTTEQIQKYIAMQTANESRTDITSALKNVLPGRSTTMKQALNTTKEKQDNKPEVAKTVTMD